MGLYALFVIALCGALFQSSSAQQNSQNPIISLYRQMHGLLMGPIAASDDTFPKIQGPKCKHAKIVIVGAGPSGLHMAHELVKRGYENITILEALSYVGGKSHSEQVAGKLNVDMGTYYFNAEYTALFKIIEENNISLHRIPRPEPELHYNGLPTMSFLQIMMGTMMKVWPNKTNDERIFGLVQTMYRYMKIHQGLFGRYNGDIMPRPSESIMSSQLNKTFDKFLIDNDMIVLRPIFEITITLMGYGQLDEASAIYGLMWNTPGVILDFATQIILKQPKIFLFKEGFQEIWNQVAVNLEKKNVKIIRSSPVRKIKIVEDYKYVIRSNGQKYNADFLIWTPSLKIAAKVIEHFKHLSAFKKFLCASEQLIPKYWTSTVINIHNSTWAKTNLWMSNIKGDRSVNSVWVDSDVAAVKNVDLGADFSGRTLISYIFGPTQPTEAEVKRILLNFYKDFNPELTSKAYIWSYFHHFSVQDMAKGILWDMFSAQGRGNAWFIGSSVSFESAKSVTNYNDLILRNFRN